MNKQFKEISKHKNAIETILSDYTRVLKNYSLQTIKTYRQHIKRFLQYYDETPPQKISDDQIRKYIL